MTSYEPVPPQGVIINDDQAAQARTVTMLRDQAIHGGKPVNVIETHVHTDGSPVTSVGQGLTTLSDDVDQHLYLVESVKIVSG
jgi:hypothetical protein